MKSKKLIFYCVAGVLLCSSFGNLNAQWQSSEIQQVDTIPLPPELLAFHKQMADSMQQTRGSGKVYHDVLMAGPFTNRDQYFYIDTKIPFSTGTAPQIHIVGYNYSHPTIPNRAVKLTLGWYCYNNAWHWTQYRCDLGYYNPSRIRLGTYNDNGTIRVRIEIANDGTYWSSYSFSANDHGGNTSYYEGWTYQTGEMPDGPVPPATVKEYNKVNIGSSTTPTTLTVVGSVNAREVNVTANAGADFVFSPSYSLRPLSEVEQFISANQHLPEIAPADEMQQNGVNMGEFQIQLLQKIEELTLYVIEQQKQIEAQNERIKELELNK